MPSLGADMEAGTLVEWLKQPGDEVHRGDIIAVVETQKGAIEIEIFEDGVFDRTLVELGTEVPVGAPLAFISAQRRRGARRTQAARIEAEAGSRFPITLPRHRRGVLPSRPGRGETNRQTVRKAHLLGTRGSG